MATSSLKQKTHKVKEWVTEHKMEIIICGGIIVCVGVGILGYRHFNSVKPIINPIIPSTLPRSMPKIDSVNHVTDSYEAIREVARQGHIRVLPNGWLASASKILQAKEVGIDLNVGETLVDSCTVKLKCA